MKRIDLSLLKRFDSMTDLNAPNLYDLQNNGVIAPSAESRTSYFDVLTASNGHLASFNSIFIAIVVGQFTSDVDRTEYAGEF